MIVDSKAYILSMILVLVSSAVRDFLIPLFVWQNHLKEKSYAYRFWFCVITQASLQINLVLLLGFFGICNRWTILLGNLVVYLLILWNFSDKKFFVRFKKAFDSLEEAHKRNRLGDYVLKEAKGRWKKFCKATLEMELWKRIGRAWLETVLLTALCIYNIWFLTRNVMEYHSYQFSDIPVHQSWIYALEYGTLYVDGIYPFGMHAMIYVIRVLTGLNLREILLYAGAYQTVVLMLGIFLLAKEIFHAKYTPITTVVIFTLMLNQGRYAASLPQETGMYAVVATAYFMIRYLHKDREKFVVANDSFLRRIFRINSYLSRRYMDSDAILLMLSVALVVNYHFYTAIVAILFVLAIGLAYFHRILKKQYLIPLLFSGLMGAVIVLTPMGFCLAKGIPFQESMAWATSVMSGEEWTGTDLDYESKMAEAMGDEGEDNLSPGSGGDVNLTPDGGAQEEEAMEEKVDYSTMTPKEILRYYWDSVFTFGIMVMFPNTAIWLMFFCMLAGAVCAVLMWLNRKTRCVGSDYMALIFNMLILCTLGAAQQLGLPEIIAAARASTFTEPFIGLIYMLPVDLLLRFMNRWKNKYYQAGLNFLSAAVCVLAVYVIFSFGWYHERFDVNQAYYNEAEYLVRNIRNTYDKNTYTIVSTTDEYYDVLGHGRHTQLSEFMNMANGNQELFTFPTEYVFFFIEKRVLQDYRYGPVDVSLEYAAEDFVYLADNQDYYFQRATIESQAYYWAEKVREIYPGSFKVYYEDDIYIAYVMKQNPYSPYDLQIDYLADYRDEIQENGWGSSAK